MLFTCSDHVQQISKNNFQRKMAGWPLVTLGKYGVKAYNIK
jgi:hypothetical protein